MNLRHQHWKTLGSRTTESARFYSIARYMQYLLHRHVVRGVQLEILFPYNEDPMLVRDFQHANLYKILTNEKFAVRFEIGSTRQNVRPAVH